MSVTQSDTLASSSISIVDSKKNNLLGGFDGFERYMYYDSMSAYSDSYGTHSIEPWPKSNSGHPYLNYSATSSQVSN